MSYCLDCGEDFRYDDCGGYNPPCVCGAHCRGCHEAEEREADEWFDAYADEAQASRTAPEQMQQPVKSPSDATSEATE